MKKLLIFFTLIILTGCWNYQELNDYAIVTGMAIDLNKDEYEVSLLIANGDKSEDGNSKAKVTVSSGKGESIYEAIKSVSLATPKELYISHLSVIVISEDIARQGVTPVLDFLLREPQSHQNFYLIIAKDSKAKDCLSILTPLADYPSQNITYNIKMTEQLQGRITDASFNSFVSKILEKGNNPVTNSLIIIGSTDKGTNEEEQQNSIIGAYTKLDTLGLFKDDKLIDWATMEESIGVNMILGDVNTFYVTIPCGNDNVVISSNNYEIKKDIEKDSITLNIQAEGMFNEVGCTIDLEDNNTIKKYQEKVEDKIKIYINKAIDKAKNIKSDVFGFGYLTYRKYPKYYNSIDDWDQHFTNLTIKTNVKFNLKNKGSLEQTIGELTK